MNSLPSHRQIINGRTFRESWNPGKPASFDPIQHAESKAHAGLSVILACVLGVLGAAALVHWWSL